MCHRLKDLMRTRKEEEEREKERKSLRDDHHRSSYHLTPTAQEKAERSQATARTGHTSP